ncbi:hypothetical protein CIHG_04947 [Coccidioides immitis H538.4]|uniref:Uncharacterized protein n=3 Tax=Coccidioides immitis TaxID=5501 RepID=A0A0J8R7H4_COCIT|nr:hypothetical protein CIRG_05456 [Coccidioides immitis RMSCC 2394]KMU80816.1 hypothetical protein CISG_08941 [Coccidioides immitis RMSCC 3703]KMU87007.1 hypothetical protein CIHG_04947 [Coccidioides immitis H538.4]
MGEDEESVGARNERGVVWLTKERESNELKSGTDPRVLRRKLMIAWLSRSFADHEDRYRKRERSPRKPQRRITRMPYILLTIGIKIGIERYSRILAIVTRNLGDGG